MAILEIKRACERKLFQLNPNIPTAYEAVSFDEPDTGLYQKVKLLIKSPSDNVYSKTYFKENAQFQVYIVGLPDKGTSEVLERAELVRSHFSKGQTLQEGNVKLHFLNTPKITGVSIVQDRLVCPVLIDILAEVTA